MVHKKVEDTFHFAGGHFYESNDRRKTPGHCLLRCITERPRNKLPRRKQRGIENLIKTYYAASGGEFNPM